MQEIPIMKHGPQLIRMAEAVEVLWFTIKVTQVPKEEY
jgi:hypothetical protein